MNSAILSIIGLLFSIGVIGQKINTVNISFDRHVIVVLEGISLTRPVENTCGEVEISNGDFDNYLYLDSLDRNHIRLQVGNVMDDDTFPKCNLSLFTDQGILALELDFDNDTRDLIRVLRETDLTYKYDKAHQIATKNELIEKESKKLERIKEIYNAVNDPDFSQIDESDFVHFSLTNIIFDRDHVYLFLVIKNNSTIPYELDDIYFSQSIKASGGKSGQKSEDFLPVLNKIEPLDKVIPSKDFRVLCYELEKFTLTKKNQLEIDIIELNGRRKGEINVSRNTFNNNARTFKND